MHTPDLDTLRLCSVLASSAFGFVFSVLWLRNRAALHFAMWAASSLIYGGIIAIFGSISPTQIVPVTILFAVLAVTDLLPLAGALQLENRKPCAPWMVLPVLAAACGHAIPAVLVREGLLLSTGAWQTVGDALGLAVGIGVPGFLLAFGPGARRSAGRRMAGAAMLCYLPGYALSIAGAFWVLPRGEWVALLAMLSDQVLLGVLNLGLLAIPAERVHRNLREAAMRDPLTGCWNRAGLHSLEATFGKIGVAVVALDVDHFKLINDRHGHAAGDEVLALIGSEARGLAEAHAGHAVRLGGDEFIVILPASGGEPTGFMATLESRLKARSLLGKGWSVSMGSSQVQAGEKGLSSTMRRADTSLYQAKAARHARAA